MTAPTIQQRLPIETSLTDGSQATSIQPDARMLIAVRVVVVTSLLMAALLIQFTVKEFLPINYLYLTTGLTYGLTILYVAVGKLFQGRTINLAIQIAGDLVIETLLIYFTGGLDSPFSFLYLVSIITAATLLYRRGGFFAASGAVILYGGLGDLLLYKVISAPQQAWIPTTPDWSFSRLYLNMATNFAGFYATALLTSYLSEKLRRTYEELDANRRNLAQLQALNQNVVESIPSGVITMTPTATITFINPAGSEILQRKPSEVVGVHISEVGFFSSADWERILATLGQENLVRGEKDGVPIGSEFRSLGYAITPLKRIEGGSYGFSLIFQDFTEVKKMEAQLRLKDRMAVVGELSAGIAHEIRNPLAAIAGSVQVLKESTALSPQEQRLMSIILKESDRLNKSIADFLRFVKPQDQRPADFDIAASLGETLDLLSHSSELNANHEIRRVIRPPSFILFGDPDQIRQVFWNIARNAVQAMPNGGILMVTTTLSGGFYRIHFTDNGQGFSEADQRRLFQPFRTNFPTGTGLGMAISYRIIQAHAGRIDVESREGFGATITISLPLVQPKVAANEPPTAIAQRY
jgi:two-component system, NtrC family, sensor histidine kinase PilS